MAYHLSHVTATFINMPSNKEDHILITSTIYVSLRDTQSEVAERIMTSKIWNKRSFRRLSK